MSDINTTVRVTVQIEIDFSQPFGPTWKMGDVYERAKRDAYQAVQKLLSGQPHMRQLGDPKVLLVLVDKREGL